MTHTHTPPESSKVLEIYLLIAQYPMLASDIRRYLSGQPITARPAGTRRKSQPA